MRIIDPETGNQVISPNFAHWQTQEDHVRRERLANRFFRSAVKAGHRGAYRRAARKIGVLLKHSPQSSKILHVLTVANSRAGDETLPTLRDTRRHAPKTMGPETIEVGDILGQFLGDI